MEETGPEKSEKLARFSDRSQGGALAKSNAQSNLQVYKDVLDERFMAAETLEECDKIISLTQKIQELERDARQLDYAQKSAEIKLQQTQQKVIFQPIQQVVASLMAFALGVYLLPNFPLASLLLLIFSLAKPLGYSLGEIGNLLDSLQGFPKKTERIIDGEKQQYDREKES